MSVPKPSKEDEEAAAKLDWSKAEKVNIPNLKPTKPSKVAEVV